ncbi:hypothetical protein, partial [Bradyrhizobium sp. BR 10289]|uniref:hypothetical protein n=1 Tax=Bradyrhizobium sp. BR 10289 TaxID=2749993 RepID=UPI001C64E65A
MAIQPLEACRDVRRAAVHQGGPAAVQRAYGREPGSPSARALLSALAWLQVSVPGQVHSAEPRALPSEQGVSPWAQAPAALRVPLPGAAEVSESDEPRRAGASAHAAEPQREAARACVAAVSYTHLTLPTTS